MKDNEWEFGVEPAVAAKCSLDDPRKVNSLQDIVTKARAIAKTKMSAITILDEDTQWIIAREGVDVERTPRAHSFCQYTIFRPGVPMIVADARHDPRFADNPMVLADSGVGFYAGVPLVDSSGYALGALCVADPAPRAHFSQMLDLVELAKRAERTICR